MESLKRDLNNVKRLVVKVGSSSITYNETGKLNLYQLECLGRQLSDLYNRGLEIVLVSSGAIAAGVGKLGLQQRPRDIPEKQASAAVGQGVLLHMYEKFFAEYGVIVGQVLLTREDFSDRKRFLNARNTIRALFKQGVIPVINENDTVAVEEIKFGDNDNLAALVGGAIDADMLVLLSDIEGLYSGDPRVDGNAYLISEVNEITSEIESLAGGVGTDLGAGGMVTKIQAARVAMHSGMVTVLARTGENNILQQILDGQKVGTAFWPSVKLDNKKQWIAYGSGVQGKINVDRGAANALMEHGKSLLPSGVIGTEGRFDVGNTVSVYFEDMEIARGVVNYSIDHLNAIKGKQTAEIIEILGYKDFDEVIHRNNLVLDI
ncbi:MAG: glutamate 5-kinase [Clostridiales bacterium]|nr:glutamate 5-kinase [Clostridiales bacterium]MCF8021492.1 glutamate 5-kinase [Clostridiales bacterium]